MRKEGARERNANCKNSGGSQHRKRISRSSKLARERTSSNSRRVSLPRDYPCFSRAAFSRFFMPFRPAPRETRYGGRAAARVINDLAFYRVKSKSCSFNQQLDRKSLLALRSSRRDAAITDIRREQSALAQKFSAIEQMAFFLISCSKSFIFLSIFQPRTS